MSHSIALGHGVHCKSNMSPEEMPGHQVLLLHRVCAETGGRGGGQGAKQAGHE